MVLVSDAFLEPLAFWLGLGLGSSGPLQVAEAGNLGGGISLCFGGCGGTSESLSAVVWALEALLLRVKLSLRRIELPIEDVLGSMGLSMLEASSLEGFLAFCSRGPLGCVDLISGVIAMGLEVSRLR